ncbi:hypothetical protein QE382_003696 [Sphingobacterium zeae]|uniref:Uncharacterized protein n=1 Tax=Sphingobacterium zeae TaxID=1776859 RepID=A0ABU0UA30_9SPHI|nr:hypothetical protein [Sphingobacterium zeae]
MKMLKMHYSTHNKVKLKRNEKDKDNDDWGRTDLCKCIAGPGK